MQTQISLFTYHGELYLWVRIQDIGVGWWTLHRAHIRVAQCTLNDGKASRMDHPAVPAQIWKTWMDIKWINTFFHIKVQDDDTNTCRHCCILYLSWRFLRSWNSTSCLYCFHHQVTQSSQTLLGLEGHGKRYSKRRVTFGLVLNMPLKIKLRLEVAVKFESNLHAVSRALCAVPLKVLFHCSLILSSPPAGSRGSACKLRAPRRLFLMDCNDSPWHLNITYHSCYWISAWYHKLFNRNT